MDSKRLARNERRQLKAARSLWLETLGFVVAIVIVAIIGAVRGVSWEYLIFAGFFLGIYVLTLAISYFKLLNPTMTPKALEDRALKSARGMREERR